MFVPPIFKILLWWTLQNHIPLFIPKHCAPKKMFILLPLLALFICYGSKNRWLRCWSQLLHILSLQIRSLPSPLQVKPSFFSNVSVQQGVFLSVLPTCDTHKWASSRFISTKCAADYTAHLSCQSVMLPNSCSACSALWNKLTNVEYYRNLDHLFNTNTFFFTTISRYITFVSLTFCLSVHIHPQKTHIFFLLQKRGSQTSNTNL